MGFLATHVKVYESNCKYDKEEYDRRSTRVAVPAVGKHLIDVTDHSTPLVVAVRTHSLVEYTYDRGIFLEATDEARDDNVREHGREERNGDTSEHAESGSRVDLSRLVILLVNALKTAEKNEDLEGERVPYDVNHENDEGVVIELILEVRALEECDRGSTGVDPVDGIDAEDAKEIVDNADIKRSALRLLRLSPQ